MSHVHSVCDRVCGCSSGELPATARGVSIGPRVKHWRRARVTSCSETASTITGDTDHDVMSICVFAVIVQYVTCDVIHLMSLIYDVLIVMYITLCLFDLSEVVTLSMHSLYWDSWHMCAASALSQLQRLDDCIGGRIRQWLFRSSRSNLTSGKYKD